MTERRTAYNLSQWQHYLSIPEVDLVKRIALLLPPDPDVLCIGAGAGTVTLAVLEERDDALYYSVDILTTESETATNEHLRLPETPYAASGHVIRIWGDSHVVGKRWRIPLDMLIIDGDHSYDGIRIELDLWLFKVKHGGYILCHDYGSLNWPHVAEIVDLVPPHLWERVALADTLIAFKRL